MTERERLEQAGKLSFVHWAVVLASVLLTLSAWYYTRNQVTQKAEIRFEQEAKRVIELVSERMQKYEDALWGATAYMRSTPGVDVAKWRLYSSNLHIEEKYPGINGIGLIDALAEDQLVGYLERQRRDRPDFRIHPSHSGETYLPIVYIEPLAQNRAALGLDIAHEKNRFDAAKKARDSGTAQITGPIILVQDEGKTPGFLFYAPLYNARVSPRSVESRREAFLGLTYAPFVVKNLIDGTLRQESRHVTLELVDGGDVLYSELDPGETDYDPNPLFRKAVTVPFYGRQWTFRIHSALSFREATSSGQPWLILLGGIIIDSLLLTLFLMISKANRQALAYADAMTHELNLRTAELEKSNEELEKFAYAASHDLKEPLRQVGSFAKLLRDHHSGKFDEEGERWLGFLVDGAQRMQALVNDLLAYSKVSHFELEMERLDLAASLRVVIQDLAPQIQEEGADIVFPPSFPAVLGDELQIRLLLQNLLSNSMKFHKPGMPPAIRVTVQAGPEFHTFCVEDNGIGIEEQYFERIFVIFKRLHARKDYPGTGIGLAICQKIVQRHQGELWVESSPEGTRMSFTLRGVET